VLTRILKKINKTISPGKLYFGPEYIVLGVNNICNLSCKMCDVGTQNLETNFAQNLLGSKPLNMPLELFERIADQTAAAFPKAKMGYAFTEPLIYPWLKESLLYAHKKGISTSITTNALNLKRKSEDLLEGRVSELFISLDGLQESHNFIRGNKRSFQKAIEGIKYISTHKHAPELSVYCVITEWNYTELEKFVDFFSNLPIKHLGLMHQNYISEETALKHNLVYGQSYKATHSNIEETDFKKIDLNVLIEQINRIKDKTYPFSLSFSPEIADIEILNNYYHHPEIKLGRTCNDVFTTMMVKSDGSVIPSHGRCYNVSMGNIYAKSLEEIWNSEAYSKFRKTLVRAGGLLPACTRCCSAF
jgi:Fe-coproporphyrin III synthase